MLQENSHIVLAIQGPLSAIICLKPNSFVCASGSHYLTVFGVEFAALPRESVKPNPCSVEAEMDAVFQYDQGCWFSAEAFH